MTIPLNGDGIINRAASALHRPRSAASILSDALQGYENLDDAPDGTNGASKSDVPPATELPAKATDPSQGYGAPRRRSGYGDPLADALMKIIAG